VARFFKCVAIRHIDALEASGYKLTDKNTLEDVIATMVSNESSRRHYLEIRGAQSGSSQIRTTEAVRSDRSQQSKSKRSSPYSGGAAGRKFEGTCNSCGRRGHRAADCRVKDPKTPSKDSKVCGHCKKKGHTEDQCYAMKRESNGSAQNSKVKSIGSKAMGKMITHRLRNTAMETMHCLNCEARWHNTNNCTSLTCCVCKGCH
jgi:hypothetical protein